MIGLVLFLIAVAVVAYVLFSNRFAGYRTKTAAWLTGIIGGVIPLAGDLGHQVLPYAFDISTYLKDLDWRQYLSESQVPFVMIGLGILFYVLRRMTGAST